MTIKVNYAKGFSLLEVLLVVSLMMVLMSFALPPFKAYQQGIQTRLAWIYMQQIALSQTEYFMTQQTYTSDFAKLAINLPQDTSYRYSLDIEDNRYTINGHLIQVQSATSACAHLQLDSQGQKQAFDQTNQVISRCLYE